MAERPVSVEPESVPHRDLANLDPRRGRRGSTVSCVRCPACRSLLHVGNIVQRRYRDRLAEAGRCVVCTKANPDRRFRVCPKCRAASRARARKWYDGQKQKAS